MIRISPAQFSALQRSQVEQIAWRIFQHLRARGMAPPAATRDDYLSGVRFALACGVDREIQIAQLAIFYVVAGRSPASSDADILSHLDAPWHERLSRVANCAFTEAQLSG